MYLTFPDWIFTRTILKRSLLIWIGVRLTIFLLGGASAIALAPKAAVMVVVVVALLTVLETHRKHEFLFLANLGVARSLVVGLTAIPATVLELVIAAIR